MYDPGRRWSLSFSGCGFLCPYYIGVTRCLSERAPRLLQDAPMVFGSSAGSLHCVGLLAGIPLDRRVQIIVALFQKARSRNLGIFHPSFCLSKCLRDGLQEHLPDNVHQLVSGKMCISLTRMSDGQNVLVSDFRSKEEVVDALVCSCFIPFYCGLIPPSFRGVRYMDGGMSDNVPLLDVKGTITVSPFYGEYDICPRVKTTNFLHVNYSNLSLHACLENVFLVYRAFFPADLKMLRELCFQGYVDAYQFLEENGFCKGPRLGPNLSSEERAPEVMAPCWENRSKEGAEPPVTLHLSSLSWDQRMLETLSPRLTVVLNKAVKDRGGLLDRVCDSVPMRILSYLLLPCTLPVESAIAAVHRATSMGSCLPDIPMTSSGCSV